MGCSLAMTSNGGEGFQFLEANNVPIFEAVVEKCKEWGSEENMMFVVGATRSEDIEK